MSKSQTAKERADSLLQRGCICLWPKSCRDIVREEFEAHARQIHFETEQNWIKACDVENPALMNSKAGAVIGTYRRRLMQQFETILLRLNNLCQDRLDKGVGHDAQLHQIVQDALEKFSDV